MSDSQVPAQAPGGDVEEPKKIKRGGRQTRFLAQSVILEEAGSSGLIRAAMVTISVVICLFLVWSALTEVDEVAVASGEVVPTGQLKSIQHLEGGIIAEIKVEDGKEVQKGELLIRLDPADAETELKQMRARRAGLELQAERLRALGTGREPDFSFVGDKFKNLVADQRSIYESQRAAGSNRREVILTQIEQKKQELALFAEQEATLSQNAELLLEELLLREDLYRRGLTSKIIYLDAKRSLNQAKGDLANIISERQRAAESLSESRRRLDEQKTDSKEQALSEMGAITSELAQINEALRKVEDRVRRLNIVAPVTGHVKDLKVFTIGGVIPPGAVLMEIVPRDAVLLVETRIATRDVGHVKRGQPVTVKVTTYDFARYGGITGELKDVSRSTFLDEQGEPYYKGIISLDRGYVGLDPESNRVLPGMTVQADIKTGKKTLLAYLLKPVVSSVKTGFRER